MKNKSSFQFIEHIITKSIFINKKINKNKKDYNLNLKPNGILNNESKQFQLALDLEIVDKDEESLLNVEIIGFFKYQGDIQDIKNFLYLNAPALLYPYLRAYVSTLTTLSGLGTYTLPTMNLIGLKDDIEKNIEIIQG
ncbi:MAG: protein-export chaperone SecB [Flavobacterium sp.]|jgi:preprotein translocase subunit SecB